ncbi:hypothetical protein D3C72_2109170 [compost metagenome]
MRKFRPGSLIPTVASSTVPKAAQKIASQNSACGMAPMIGNSVTYPERPNRIGRKTTSVMTELIRLMPSPSSVEENRIVSSCTRCEAPSICRNCSHLDM